MSDSVAVAVIGETYQLAAGIALHGLRLAITSVVVGAATLVAGSSTVGGNSVVEATAEATTEAWATRTASTRSSHARSWAVASDVAHLTARIAAAASGASGNAQSRTVSLNVTETLAVVALFGCKHCQTLCCDLVGRLLLSVVRGCGHWLLS